MGREARVPRVLWRCPRCKEEYYLAPTVNRAGCGLCMMQEGRTEWLVRVEGEHGSGGPGRPKP